MKAIQIHEPGDVSQLSISDLLISDPNANEVQVRVSYAGVNFMDIGTRNGQLKRMMPFIPGVEGSGVITNMGVPLLSPVANYRARGLTWVSWLNPV